MTDADDDLPPLPPFLDDADAVNAVSYLTLTHSRMQLMTRIGNTVGFTVEGDRDRLRSEELAQIVVWMLAVRGDI